MRLLDVLRTLSPRTIASVAAGHVVLLAGILWGGLPYVVLQVLFAAELVLLKLATIPLFRERGLRQHLFDALKLIGGLVFILFFVMLTYGIAAGGDDGNPLAFGIQGLTGASGNAVWWALLYIVIHVAGSLWQAFAAPDPRRAWAQNTLMEGVVTYVAMLVMVFVAAFLGRPIAAGLASIGADVGVSALLAGLMVAVRFVLALVVAAIPALQLDALTADSVSGLSRLRAGVARSRGGRK